MTKLEPCPFCRSDAALVEGHWHKSFWVSCTACGARIRTCNDAASAAALWNGRADPAADKKKEGEEEAVITGIKPCRVCRVEPEWRQLSTATGVVLYTLAHECATTARGRRDMVAALWNGDNGLSDAAKGEAVTLLAEALLLLGEWAVDVEEAGKTATEDRGRYDVVAFQAGPLRELLDVALERCRAGRALHRAAIKAKRAVRQAILSPDPTSALERLILSGTLPADTAASAQRLLDRLAPAVAKDKGGAGG